MCLFKWKGTSAFKLAHKIVLVLQQKGCLFYALQKFSKLKEKKKKEEILGADSGFCIRLCSSVLCFFWIMENKM